MSRLESVFRENWERMVYCTKCGTLNPDDATVCSNCGAALQSGSAQQHGQSRPYARRWQWEDWEHYREYHRRSGGFAALAIGLLIVLLGFSVLAAETYNINIPWGAIVLIFFGLLIIIAGFRARRYYRRET
jgi:ribosomal protein L40E